MALSELSAGNSIYASELNTNFKTLLTWVIGNKLDGNITISSNTTMITDYYCDTLTIDSGYSLDTNGYRIFARKVINNGTIKFNGGDASGTTAPDAGGRGGLFKTFPGGGSGSSSQYYTALNLVTSDNSTTARSSIAIPLNMQVREIPGIPGNYYIGGAIGGTDDTGASNNSRFISYPASNASQVNSSDYTDTSSTDLNILKAMGIYPASILQVLRYPMFIHPYMYYADSNRYYFWTYIVGGFGGAGGTGTDAGAGGAGGGVIMIIAEEIENNGTIEAKGGDGSDAVAGSGSGGGAGGDGGAVILVYNKYTNTGTVDMSGGTGGLGDGGAGDGSDGADGVVYEIPLTY